MLGYQSWRIDLERFLKESSKVSMYLEFQRYDTFFVGQQAAKDCIIWCIFLLCNLVWHHWSFFYFSIFLTCEAFHYIEDRLFHSLGKSERSNVNLKEAGGVIFFGPLLWLQEVKRSAITYRILGHYRECGEMWGIKSHFEKMRYWIFLIIQTSRAEC